MDEMRAELTRAVHLAGGVKAFCRSRGLESHATVSLAMSGKREVSEAVANCCGFFRETTFVKMAGRT